MSSAPKYFFTIQDLRLIIISSYEDFSSRYPEMKTIDVQLLGDYVDDSSPWDFFMTVGSSLGAIVFNSDKENQIMEELKAIHPSMPKALEDLIRFIGEDKDIASRIGIWVIWNMKKAKPTYEEIKRLAPALGKFLMILSETYGKPLTNNKNE